MRKLGDEGSERREPREKEVAFAGDSVREMREGAMEEPLQKLIEKIVGSWRDNEVHSQEGHIGDENTR